MNEIKLIKLFISCPSDIIDEQDSIQFVTNEINKTSGKHNNFYLELLNRKVDTYTQIGEDAQDVINNQIDSQYDILIGVLWQKIGTQTNRDKSGTIEEINRSIKNNKEFLIYFKTLPPDSLNSININELSKIQDFKNELSGKGVLYKEFNSVKNFESLFRIHLTNLIIDKKLNTTPINTKTQEQEVVIKKHTSKYESIETLIEKIENKDQVTYDIDFFNLLEENTVNINLLTESLGSLTNSLSTFSDNLSKKTNEITNTKNIKDNKLRENKVKKILKEIIGILENLNINIKDELNNFSENIISVGNSYSKLMLFASNFENSETEPLKEALISYRDTSVTSMESAAGMISEFLKWPPINHEFNKKKGETEIVLKDMLKIMLDGTKLLDEAIDIGANLNK